jgi:hypothetical protein
MMDMEYYEVLAPRVVFFSMHLDQSYGSCCVRDILIGHYIVTFAASPPSIQREISDRSLPTCLRRATKIHQIEAIETIFKLFYFYEYII